MDEERSPLRQNFNVDEELALQEQQAERPNATSRLGYLTDTAHLEEPATPPYRRDPSTSQVDFRDRMPPEYRSHHAPSTASVHDYPDEKASLRRKQGSGRDDDDRSVGTHTEDEHSVSQYATASTMRKAVHYPDTDGDGRLHNVTPKAQRFTKTDVEGRTEGFRTHSRASSIASDDAEDDNDETYDWSDEGDLVDEEAKYEKKMGTSKSEKRWGLWRFITFFFSTLIGSALLSGALVAAAVLLRIYWLKPHRTDHRTYVMDNVEAWLFWAAANVLISWWLASFIDLFPHVLTLCVDIVWGTVSEAWKSNLELYHSAKVWVKPLFYAACSWVSWVIIFEGVFELYDGHVESQSRASYTPRVYQVIRFLFFLTLCVCLEKLFIQIVALSFHRTAYKERLDGVAKAIKVLDHLRDHKPKRRDGHVSHASRSGMGLFSMMAGAVLPRDSDLDSPARGHKAPRRKRTLEPGALEEGVTDHDGDRENSLDEPEGASTPNKPRKRASWMNLTKFTSPPSSKPSSRTVSRKNSAIPMQDSPLHHYPPTLPHQAKDPSRSGIETPATSSGRQTPVDVEHHIRRSLEGVLDSHLLQTAGRAFKTAVLHDARNITGADGDAESALIFGLNSPHEAKHLARELFHAFLADRRRKYLIPSDFFPAYKTPEEARDAFKVFDNDGNADATRAEFKTAILKIYKERRFLTRSLRDAGAAINTLDQITLVFFMIVLIFIALPIFGIEFSTKTFSSSIYTLFIGASFIFKNAASNMFDSVMFLFVTHPFDTGDRCFIDSENLVVRKMGIFATQFVRSDGSHMYYFNTMLVNKFINNARRSGNMAENLEMQVHWRTPQWKLDALEKKLNEWIDSDEKRWFKPGTSISFSKIEFQKSLYLTIGIGHNGTWQDWGLRQARKTAFHAATQYYCRELNITCSDSPQPVVFVDNDTDRLFTEEDEDEQYEPITPRSPIAPSATRVPESRHALLGFLPPRGKNQLRVRRANKKKLMGASEGDAS